MARITISTDDRHHVVLEELHARPDTLLDPHAAVGFLDRLEWAIWQAEAYRPDRKPRSRLRVPPQSALTQTFD